MSARSDRRGIVLTALPTSYDGPVPAWPLSRATKRELDVWAETWTRPQANAWAQPSEAWRVPDVAMFVRVFVRCEARDSSANLLAQLHRLKDAVGLTDAGLKAMGWRVAADELAAKAAARTPPADDAPRRGKRLRTAADGGA